MALRLLDDIESASNQVLGTNMLRRKKYHLLCYQAENYLATGFLKKAEALLEQAHEIAKTMQVREVQTMDLLHRGAFLLARGIYDKAYEQLNAAISLANETKLPDLEWRGHYLLGNLLSKKGEIAAAQRAYQQAIHIIESLTFYVPERELMMSFLAERYDPYRALVAFKSHELNDPVSAFGYLEKFKARVFLKELASKTPEGKLSMEKSVEVSKTLHLIQEQLPHDVRIVAYFIGSVETLVFIVSPTFFHYVSLPVGRDKIASLADAFLDHMRKRKQEETKQVGKELYTILIRPIESYLAKQSTLCIIPDDKLFYIPFPALITKDDRFLIEEYRFTRAPSATVLTQCLHLNKGTTDGKRRKVLVVATDDGLPQASTEARTIYEYYKPYSTYVSQPNSQELPGLVQDFEIVHFVGHSEVNKDGYPVLIFASPTPSAGPLARTLPRQEPRGLRWDEVLRWNLSNVSLVNLSACETGLGRYLHGEGMVGLAYAFLSVRAPALMVTLWEVYGGASRALMERFYTNLREDGMSKAEALRRAQIDMIRSNGPYKAPYYWAPFILVGDPR